MKMIREESSICEICNSQEYVFNFTEDETKLGVTLCRSCVLEISECQEE